MQLAMNNLSLYCLTTVIWGSTWLAVQYQINTVSPIWSIHYRFLIAALLLISYCVVNKRPMRFGLQEHCTMALQGTLMFCMNFIGYYYGSVYLISGMVALLTASIIIMNIINTRVLLKQPVAQQVAIGASIGLFGLIVVFSSEITRTASEIDDYWQIALGLFCTLMGSFFASLGHIISYQNQKRALPILQTNAFAMGYGALATLIIACCLGHKPSFDFSMSYIGSLLYLSLVGSVVAFSCYLKLLGRIGAERASYTFILLPVISLVLSSWFESFHWRWEVIYGLFFILLGNIIVLKYRAPVKTN